MNKKKRRARFLRPFVKSDDNFVVGKKALFLHESHRFYCAVAAQLDEIHALRHVVETNHGVRAAVFHAVNHGASHAVNLQAADIAAAFDAELVLGRIRVNHQATEVLADGIVHFEVGDEVA